jgi:hypothetical protein
MELDRDAARILELTREARMPRAGDKDRVARRLAGAFALGTLSSHAGTLATTKTVGTALVAKWAVVTATAAAAGAGYLGLFTRTAPEHLATSTAPSFTSPVLEIERKEPLIVQAGQAVPLDEHGPQHDERPRRSPAARSAVTRSTLPEELDLLHAAQAKWRSGNASDALSLIAEHRARFPRSALGPERDALAVLSLCATNRGAEAKRLARHFLATAPRSPLKTSVEESCGGK